MALDLPNDKRQRAPYPCVLCRKRPQLKNSPFCKMCWTPEREAQALQNEDLITTPDGMPMTRNAARVFYPELVNQDFAQKISNLGGTLKLPSLERFIPSNGARNGLDLSQEALEAALKASAIAREREIAAQQAYLLNEYTPAPPIGYAIGPAGYPTKDSERPKPPETPSAPAVKIVQDEARDKRAARGL